jgi:hypothetical protein
MYPNDRPSARAGDGLGEGVVGGADVGCGLVVGRVGVGLLVTVVVAFVQAAARNVATHPAIKRRR